MEQVVKTQNLCCRYGKFEAVHNLSMEINANSIYGLLGPNGAGKTTSLLTLVNAITPKSGSARVLGIDSTKLAPKHFQKIGYVSEAQKVPEWMTVTQLTRFYRAIYVNWDQAFCEQLIRLLDIPANLSIKKLSRGGRVKISLLLAMSFRPELMILDEPFSGLDVVVRQELIEALLV